MILPAYLSVSFFVAESICLPICLSLVMIPAMFRVACVYVCVTFFYVCIACVCICTAYPTPNERWGAGVETQKNVRGEIWGWGRVPFNEPYAPSLSTIHDGA